MNFFGCRIDYGRVAVAVFYFYKLLTINLIVFLIDCVEKKRKDREKERKERERVCVLQ